MPLTIPLKLAPGAPAIEKSGGLKLKLPVLGNITTRNSSRTRQQEALKAVGVATALYDAKASLKLAITVEKSPEQAISPALDEEKLGKILSNVTSVQSGEVKAGDISPRLRAAALSAGARPELVAAAAEAITSGANKAEQDAIAAEARKWVAAVRPDVLAEAARTGSKITELNRVPTPASRSSALEKRVTAVEGLVDDLGVEQAAIADRVTCLEQQGGQVAAAPE